MSRTIRKIIVFGKDGTQRNVDLKTGLNIITGYSKKGKSALIEIVDYCLCSSLPTIPKGVISDYASLYCLALIIDDSYLIIARPAWEISESNKVYVEYENIDFDIDTINSSYFQDKTMHKIKGGGQELIERHLGLHVSNTQLPNSNAKPRKASIRNLTPFLFQYQNLIASKHALFSKLDDHFKKKDIVEQIPIFLGVVNDEYYTLRRQADELEQKLKKIDKEKEKDKQFHSEYERRLDGLYRNYHSVVGVPYEGYRNLQELISKKNNLPELDEAEYLKTDFVRRYKKLEQKQADLVFRLDEINLEISDISQIQRYANKTATSLNTEKTKNETALVNEALCPICGTETENLVKEADDIKSALNNLDSEIRSMVSFARFDSEQLEILHAAKRDLQNEIRENKAELEVLESYNKRIHKYKNKKESIMFLKAQIQLIADQVARKVSVTDYGDSDIREELKTLRSKLSSFDFQKALHKAESSLIAWMSSMCNKLDFEDEFRPAKLSMKLDELVVKHSDKKYGNVSLSDMGSGANWLAFHISASMSMLRLFSQTKKSIVPNFLFLDQPSQVYFPDSFNKDGVDKKHVENIYISLINELRDIEKYSGTKAQVIILDHASDLDLGEYKFKDYVRYDWHGDDALI